MIHKITALLEVLREYVDDGGSQEIYQEANAELIGLIPHEPGCNSFIRERDDAGRFASYACNCERGKIVKKIAKTGQE